MSRHRTSLSLNRCAPLFFIAFFVVASSVLSVPAASPQTAADADGTLDLTFAAQGKLRSDFTDKYDALMTFALLPDGKLVVIGKIYSLTSDDPADEPFFLRRYNSDGSLDTSFGNGGQVLGTVGKLKSFSKLVPLPDGKLLAGGAAYDGGTDFGLARFNSDGSLDRSFGNNGTVLTNAGAADYASDLIVLPDGKILLGGDGGRPNRQASAFIVARYNASGSLDRTFGDNGLASVTFSKGFDTVYGFALQPDGKIVVAGERDFNAPDRSFALARFNSDGSLDNSFGSEGKVTTAFSGQRCEAYAIALQPDGKIIAAGYSTQTTRPTHILAMARYNSDGSLDRSFGNGGKVSNDFFGRGGEAHTLALQRDGKIIVGATAGYSAAGSPNVDYAVLRYNKDGSLDSSFDGGGIAITDCGDIIDSPYVMAIQPDGKIILGGTSGDQQSRADMVIVRYNNTSAPFDTCIQDDSSGNLLQFNSTTGAYQFTVCATGFTLSGQGTVSVKGCKMKLQAAAADRNLTVTIQTCKGKASAQIDALAEVQIYHITDSSIANNTCGCH